MTPHGQIPHYIPRHDGACKKFFYPSERPSPHLRVTGECAQNEGARTVRVAGVGGGGAAPSSASGGVEAKS